MIKLHFVIRGFEYGKINVMLMLEKIFIMIDTLAMDCSFSKDVVV